MATQNGSQIRINGLEQIANTLLMVYKPELIKSLKTTLLDILQKAIKKGKGEEQTLGAQIVPLLILQIGDGAETMKMMTPLLNKVMLNKSTSSAIRAKCCSALTLSQFLADEHSDNTLQLMQQLENIFDECINEDKIELQRSALTGWGLLLTRVPSASVMKLYKRGAFLL